MTHTTHLVMELRPYFESVKIEIRCPLCLHQHIAMTSYADWKRVGNELRLTVTWSHPCIREELPS